MTSETFEETRARLRGFYGRDDLHERSLVLPVESTRRLLERALENLYPSKMVWVRDFHDGWVVFELEWLVGEQYHSETKRRDYTHGSDGITLGDSEVEVQRLTTWEPVRAFLTEVNDRTILTAPANAVSEKASHEHMLKMRGRFVGAEKANRNGALWTTADLQMGQPTVTNGPLNWLHEARHVIGSISRSELVMPKNEQADVAEPYIAAESSVWKWLYPQEAQIIEQASEQGKLWYSMECISENVHCGEGCGAYPYMDVVRAAEAVCDHIKARTTTRRFENPTFLGGAVIVPPVRPGWGDASAELLQEAASYAERAYDQAGRPDMRSSEWEHLMAEVLRFARG